MNDLLGNHFLIELVKVFEFLMANFRPGPDLGRRKPPIAGGSSFGGLTYGK